ncbi:hypothetical protein HDU93_010103, partial [Gonapodya sp. JEL0774]
ATLFGVLNHLFLPSYPQTAGFMSIEEKEIVIGRLPEHARHQSAMTNIDIHDALETFRDWRMYALSLSLMFSVSAIIAIGYFLPGVIYEMGNWSSDYYKEKTFHGLACFSPSILQYVLLVTAQSYLTPWGRYGLLFLGSLSNGILPILIGLSSITTEGAVKTAVRTAFTLTCGNI